MFGTLMNGLTGAMAVLTVLGGLSLVLRPAVWLAAPVLVPVGMTAADNLLGNDEGFDELED